MAFGFCDNSSTFVPTEIAPLSSTIQCISDFVLGRPSVGVR